MRTPGFGDSDWTRVISELRLAGYRGAIDIEGWHDPVYRGDLEITGQVRALEYLKECRGGAATCSIANPTDGSAGHERRRQPGNCASPSLTREQREEVHEHHA